MSDRINGKDKDELTLIIEGREIIIENGKLVKTINTATDVFSCVMPWEPGLDSYIDEITAPFSYSECFIYIGGILQMKGILYNVGHAIDEGGSVKNLEIYSKTADLIDSSVRFPFETNNMTLFERIESQLNSTVTNRQFSELSVEIDDGVDIGSKFSRIDAKYSDNCFERIAKLAAERGLLVSNTIEGNLLIIKPNVNSKPVGTIIEGDSITEKFNIEFKGRERWKYYQSFSSSSKSSKTKKTQEASDLSIPRDRFLSFDAPDSLPGEAKNAAEWKKNKSAADSLDMKFPVREWYAPNGEIWQPNTTVSVVSPTIGITTGYTFLIVAVEYNYNSDGSPAVLDLKPPTAYTTGIIEEPWR